MTTPTPAVDKSAVAALVKRARAKFATVPLATRLADVAKAQREASDTAAVARQRTGRLAAARPRVVLSQGHGPPTYNIQQRGTLGGRLGLLEQSYRNSVYCCGALTQHGETITGRWCGNRWCLACSRVRTARAWARYSSHLQEWKAPYMVTLTVPNVKADALHAELRIMLRRCARAKDAMRKAGIRLVALRKVECTYNVARDDFHPHFHLIVDGHEAARALLVRWLRDTPGASEAAQDVRPADSGALAELFKYFTKLTTAKSPIPAVALDVIFRAMRGLRVFQPIGFTAPLADGMLDEDAPVNEAARAPDASKGRASYSWNFAVGDWVDVSTGEVLSGYEPGERFRAYVGALGAPPKPKD